MITCDGILQETPDLSNTTVLIIGGSYGIGRGIADALAKECARVIVLSRTDPMLNSSSITSSLEWWPIDLSQPDESRMQLTAVLNAVGNQLDAVFYSAIYYGSKRSSFLAVNEDEWRRQLNINLHGLWITLSLTLPALQRRAPSLFVHLSSEVAYNAGPWRSGYAATKAAASNLMCSIAQEDPKEKVRLVQLLPDKMVDTLGVRKRRPDNFDYSDYMTPEHFQQAALHLLRTRGEGMHGESLVVDGQGKLRFVNESVPPSQSRRD